MLKYITLQIEALPSPWRHALFALLASEAMIVANGFAGATSFADLKLAIGGIVLALITGAARWAQLVLAST